MLKVYCYDRCSTCKKALKWLDEKGVQFELLDIKGDFLQEKEVIKYDRFIFTVIKVIKHRIAKVKVTVNEE